VSEQYEGPPTRVRIVGRALNAAVARAPWSWPLLRGPMRRYFDAAAPGWDERTGAGSVDHLTPLAVAVTALDREPERILDVGTGTGEAALFLSREFPRASIRGVDISEEMVHAAQTKVGLDPEGRIAFRVADAGDLPYEADSFDLLTHVNVPPFFGEIARVLRPGGHVIFVATRGAATPFYTPEAVLERGLRRKGIETLARAEAGRGTYLVGRAGSLI
jgi:ubiquinone/menaquinone biosynthesis C-methylase UbiE